MDYLRYYLCSAVVLLGIVGIALGGFWSWLGFSTFFTVFIIDSVAGIDDRPRNMANPVAADLVLYLHTLLMVVLYGCFFWRAVHGYGLEGFSETLSWTGAVATIVLLNLVPNAGIAHELMHKKTWLPRRCGNLLFSIIGSPNRDVGHVASHHIHFDTLDDPDTGRRGESVYAFVWRCIQGSTRDVIVHEQQRFGPIGAFINPCSRILLGSAAVIAMLVSMYLIAGTTGALALAGIMVVSRFLGEALNYVQHYGLLRVPDSPNQNHHTWNHLSWIIRVLGVEITNHIDHHNDPDAPYYQLVPHAEAPQMRNILSWGITAFFPSLWAKRIQPHLERWDKEFATPAEQQLARQANQRAGWPDWLAD